MSSKPLPQDFYDRAIAAYNDRLGPLVKQNQSLKAICLVLGVGLAVSALTNGALGYVVASRPVEIVKIPVPMKGQAEPTRQLAGQAVTLEEKDRAVLEQTLSTYVQKLRSVPLDSELILKNMREAQRMSSSSVVQYLKDYYQPQDLQSKTFPLAIVNSQRVDLEVKTIRKLSSSTYVVDWEETRQNISPVYKLPAEKWTSTITFTVATGDAAASLNYADNPLGLLITSLEWSKVQ